MAANSTAGFSVNSTSDASSISLIPRAMPLLH
jgi:hypothetical protein